MDFTAKGTPCLSLRHFYRVMEILEEIRAEIGLQDLTMEDVMRQFAIEERDTDDTTPDVSLGELQERAVANAPFARAMVMA